MRGKRLATAVLALVMVGGLAACGDDDDDDDVSIGGRGADQPADLVAVDFDFEPKEFSVVQDEEVTFTIKNDSESEHNFTISALDIDEDIPAGETKDITLTAPEVPSGADIEGDPFYYFYCKYHQTDGMQGQMKVT